MAWKFSADQLAALVKDRDKNENQIPSEYRGLSGIIEGIGSNADTGLSMSEEMTDFKDRKEHFGTNTIPPEKPRSFFSFLFDALKDETLIILMVAAVVSIGLGVGLPPPGETRSKGWIEGTAILMAVVLVSLVTSINDYSKDKKFRKLSEVSEDRAIRVTREGKEKMVSTFDLVVGDIVTLETGSYIPADMLFVSGQNLGVDESTMTGESDQKEKNEEDPFLLANCKVMEGFAKGVVIATGTNSVYGKIKDSLKKEESDTPLQEKLTDMAELIGKLGLGAAILTFIALVLKWSITAYAIDKKPWQWRELTVLVDFAIIGITIVVVAVPEGLPLAVTLSLAYSMMKMMKDNNLVRHLAACETMGGATNICSDKTGTLTQNKMTVVRLRIGTSQTMENFVEEASDNSIKPSTLELLTTGISVNSTAVITPSRELIGAKTECAMLEMVERLGTDFVQVRKDAQVLKLVPFTAQRKRMSAIVSNGSHNRLYCKGAAEVVLDLCEFVLDENGQPVSILEHKRELTNLISDWASDGLRTLTMAYSDIHREGDEGEGFNMNQLESGLTLIGIVGIEDPLRKEVPDSVAACKKAGIIVRMLTGDNILTAKKIAKNCGILSEDGIAIEGPKFRDLSIQEMDKMIPRLQVIARCSPEDKLILVTRLRELGEVVAVTGDGTNDAPILREADVGFAMGISGTEVAKDASDIILLDDNFSSIEKAVLWGRNVFASIRKFLQFQLTVNVVAVAIAFLGAVTTGDSPLKAIQLLWVNLIMDTLAALALATEPPSPELLEEPPYGRHSRLITWRMWRNIAGQAIFQLGTLLFILYGGQFIPFLKLQDPFTPIENPLVVDPRTTIVFNTFVFCQLFNEINCRRLDNNFNVFKGIFSSFIFPGIMIATIIVQFLLIQFGEYFAETVALTWEQWLFCVGVGFISLPLGFFLKLIPVPVDRKYAKYVPVSEKQPLIKSTPVELDPEESDFLDDDITPIRKRSFFSWMSKKKDPAFV